MSIKVKTKKTIKDILGFTYYHLYRKYKNTIGAKSLIYHAFGSKLKHDTYGISISMDNFRSHISYLRENYEFTYINKIPDNKFHISLTIDDGYECTNDAIDLLHSYNIPVTIFITSDNIDKKQYLTSKDLINISKLPNVQIGSHGLSHSKLSDLSYDDQYTELKQSKKALSDIINQEINGLSFPHGSFNMQTIEIISKLKYDYAATSKKGINSIATDKYLLCRDEIISTDSIKDLRKKIQGFYEYY